MASSSPYVKTNDRMRRAKSEISHNRISAETLRTEFRSRFFDKLRHSRSKSVDRLRQIVEDYGEKIDYKSISDIRRVLLQDKDGSNLLQSEVVNDLLNQIEQELEQMNLNKEVEEYVTTADKETDDTLNRLLKVCYLCGQRSDENDICGSCEREFSSEFK